MKPNLKLMCMYCEERVFDRLFKPICWRCRDKIKKKRANGIRNIAMILNQAAKEIEEEK